MTALVTNRQKQTRKTNKIETVPGHDSYSHKPSETIYQNMRSKPGFHSCKVRKVTNVRNRYNQVPNLI